MQSATDTLPDDVEQLKKLLLLKDSKLEKNAQEIKKLKQQYQNMLEQFRLAQHKQFGKSAEVNADQLGLFNEAEEISQHTDETNLKESPEKNTAKKQPKRQPLPDSLPRETLVHDIPEQDKHCEGCGHPLHNMGEETSEQLEFVPAHIKVIVHKRPKYSCRHCEQQGIKVNIKIAPAPLSPLPKSFATASLLSQIITSKYQYALPLYRQENLFKQSGIDLSRQTMASWLLKLTPLFQPVVVKIREMQLQQSVIHADETPLKVINEDTHTSYMWVYCTGTDSPENHKDKPPNTVIYDYQNSRAGRCVETYLDDFKGYLQVDGYVGYEKTQTTLVGCWAHARRKFIEAQRAQVKGKTGKADWAINHIQKLYRIETEFKNKTAQEKQQVRQTQSKALLAQFKTWLDKSALHVPPKSSIGKAVAYSLRQWPKLTQFIEHGYLSIDNNRAERAIKPFVIGRKNWMFSNTTKGAEASAVLYSLIETAKANGLRPYDYLKLLLEQLPKNPESIEHLLPWNVELTQSSPVE